MELHFFFAMPLISCSIADKIEFKNGVSAMAFSKGKRIEDEMSKRIIDIAMNIGCREGADALTVTRLCRDLNCDRRVIYNRFRDIDEINLLVAKRCNEELLAKARGAMRPQVSYFDNFMAYVQAAFTYIYEKNPHFQHYTALCRVTEDGIQNEILQDLVSLIEEGMASGDVRADTDSRAAAESIWHLSVSVGGMLAAHANYKYQDAMHIVLYGVQAILRDLLG